MATEGYIRYRADYKYQLANDYKINTSIKPESNIDTDFISLDVDGNLLVKKGYAWDGPSGPVIDTKENMRASLVHDALYQLMRNGYLSAKNHRKAADQLFKDICQNDGVSRLRALAYYNTLRIFGSHAASPQNKKIIHHAPNT